MGVCFAPLSRLKSAPCVTASLTNSSSLWLVAQNKRIDPLYDRLEASQASTKAPALTKAIAISRVADRLDTVANVSKRCYNLLYLRGPFFYAARLF